MNDERRRLTAHLAADAEREQTEQHGGGYREDDIRTGLERVQHHESLNQSQPLNKHGANAQAVAANLCAPRMRALTYRHRALT